MEGIILFDLYGRWEHTDSSAGGSAIVGILRLRRLG